jgi:hypothetical protein
MIDPATRHIALRVCRALHADDPVQAEPCDACLAAAQRARQQAERQQIEAAGAGPG